MPEHTILVAFTMEADTREQAHQKLLWLLPVNTPPGIESWWVAEDDRTDGSDCDSAVFVTPGAQALASEALHKMGLSTVQNVVDDRESIF